MGMILVVTRQLPMQPSFVHCVVMPSDDPAVDDQEHYLSSVADANIEEFKNRFPEFKQAVFTQTFLSGNEVC